MVTTKKLQTKGNVIANQAELNYLPENATEFATEFFLVQPTVVYLTAVYTVHNINHQLNNIQ